MFNQDWKNAEKKVDPDFEGSIYQQMEMDAELCPTCGAHLKDKICLNACHLSERILAHGSSACGQA